MISDENTNINLNSKQLTPTINNMAKRNPNVLHSILSQQRPIAPKNGSPISMKSIAHEKKVNRIYLLFIFSNTCIVTIDITNDKFFTWHR